MKKQKNTLLIIGIVLAGLTVLLVIITVVTFSYYKKKWEKELPGVPGITHVPLSGELDPYQVVTEYYQSMMGSIPGGTYDPETAKKYTTSKFAKGIENPAFAPTSFCIQDGPDDVRIDTADIGKKKATVKVSASYGGSWSQLWEVSLVSEKGEWKISDIKCLGISGPTGDPNDTDPYAGQKVDDIPVYIGSTVRSFYEDGSTQNAGYTAPKGTTSQQVLQYYETNMPAWGWTKIASDSDRSRTFKHEDGRTAEVWIYYSNASEGVEYVIDCPPLNSALPAQ